MGQGASTRSAVAGRGGGNGSLLACLSAFIPSLGTLPAIRFVFSGGLLLLLLLGSEYFTMPSGHSKHKSGKRLEATGKQTLLLTGNHWQAITFVLTGRQSLLRTSRLLLSYPQQLAANVSGPDDPQLLDLLSLQELGQWQVEITSIRFRDRLPAKVAQAAKNFVLGQFTAKDRDIP